MVLKYPGNMTEDKEVSKAEVLADWLYLNRALQLGLTLDVERIGDHSVLLRFKCGFGFG